MKKFSIACLIIFLITVFGFNLGGQYIRAFFSPTVTYMYPELTTYGEAFYWSLPDATVHFGETEPYIYKLTLDDTRTREQAYYAQKIEIPNAVYDDQGNCFVDSYILKNSDMIIVGFTDAMEDGMYVKIQN